METHENGYWARKTSLIYEKGIQQVEPPPGLQQLAMLTSSVIPIHSKHEECFKRFMMSNSYVAQMMKLTRIVLYDVTLIVVSLN